MKVIVFDNDNSTLDLLSVFLTCRGHDAQVFPEPHICSFNLLDDNQCPSSEPCADAVIINMKTPTSEALEALTGLIENGCKLRPANRAIMSAAMSKQQEAEIRGRGFHPIRKPFRLSEIQGWLENSVVR